MAQAKALYEGAREVYDQATKEYDDRIPNPPPGGLQRVMKMYDHTMQNYRIALSRFNESIFKRGKQERPATRRSQKAATQI